MDDNLADYRRFCANRLKRLERCKKTKSFCNLDDEVPHPFASSGSDLKGSEFLASHSGSIMFSRCSENAVLNSVKSETAPFCSGTNMFCSRSKASITDTSGVFSISVRSPTAETNSAKLSAVTSSWFKNSWKCTPNVVQTDNGSNDNHHLSSSSCSLPYSFLTTPLSILPSQSSILSTKKPDLMMTRTTMTAVNNDNDCGDFNRGEQRNFDLLREKMISLMENDVRLLQQLLALGDSIQELKSQACRCSRLSLNSLEEENADEEEWYSNDTVKTTLGDSISAITNLYVDDEPKENRSKQYFSRKNSVLRIPIPPRSSNRMSRNEKLHRRLSRLSQRCGQLNQQQQQQHELVENSSQTGNDLKSRRDHSSIIVVTSPSPYQTKSFQLRAPSAPVNMKQIFGTTDSRISSGSIDSGIRDESCSNSSADSLSPFLKDEKS